MSDLDVLRAHRKVRIEGCVCGFADLGKDHLEHVARMLAEERERKGLVLVSLELLQVTADTLAKTNGVRLAIRSAIGDYGSV